MIMTSLLLLNNHIFGQTFVCRGSQFNSTLFYADRYRWTLIGPNQTDVSGNNNGNTSSTIRLLNNGATQIMWGDILSDAQTVTITVGAFAPVGNFIVRKERFSQSWFSSPTLLSVSEQFISINVIPSTVVPAPTINDVAPDCSGIFFGVNNINNGKISNGSGSPILRDFEDNVDLVSRNTLTYTWIVSSPMATQNQGEGTRKLLTVVPGGFPQQTQVIASASSCPGVNAVTVTAPPFTAGPLVVSQIDGVPPQVCVNDNLNASVSSNQCLVNPTWTVSNSRLTLFSPSNSASTYNANFGIGNNVGSCTVTFTATSFAGTPVTRQATVQVLARSTQFCRNPAIRPNNNGGSNTIGVGISRSKALIYPNPATDEIFIEDIQDAQTIRVMDILGNVKEQINVKDVDYQIKVNTNKYANGTYLIQIQSTTGEITTQKIQVLK